ncbi:hypothetical protein ACPPVO_43345 [Dactylosporangium sp. McL0621]|uniref:hypothetical protein n=1 Tax=Dactylosporangium sp. McL0621 TaxID=3415678 RepID=UPI003CF946DE
MVPAGLPVLPSRVAPGKVTEPAGTQNRLLFTVGLLAAPARYVAPLSPNVPSAVRWLNTYGVNFGIRDRGMRSAGTTSGGR